MRADVIYTETHTDSSLLRTERENDESPQREEKSQLDLQFDNTHTHTNTLVPFFTTTCLTSDLHALTPVSFNGSMCCCASTTLQAVLSLFIPPKHNVMHH